MHSDFQPIMKFPSNGLIHFLINYFLWVPNNIQYVFGYKTILVDLNSLKSFKMFSCNDCEVGYSEKIKMKKSCWDSFFLLYYIIINYFYFGHFLIWTCFASQNWTSIFRQLGWFPLGGAKLPMISKHDNFRIFYRRTKSEPALKCSRKELFKTV